MTQTLCKCRIVSGVADMPYCDKTGKFKWAFVESCETHKIKTRASICRD